LKRIYATKKAWDDWLMSRLMPKPTFQNLEPHMQNLTSPNISDRAAYAKSLIAVLSVAMESENGPPTAGDIETVLFVVGELLSTKQD
jgi:hypothetical protein